MVWARQSVLKITSIYKGSGYIAILRKVLSRWETETQVHFLLTLKSAGCLTKMEYSKCIIACALWHSHWSDRQKINYFYCLDCCDSLNQVPAKVSGKVIRALCFQMVSLLEPKDDIRPLPANETFSPRKIRIKVSYLLFGAFLQSDPVLSIWADIHFVGLDKVSPPRLLGNGALGAYGWDEP